MSPTEWKNLYLNKTQFAPLGIIALEGCKGLAGLIDRRLSTQRQEFSAKHPKNKLPDGFDRESFLIDFNCFRFMNGEGKAVIHETVRGHDIFILADVGNYSCKFKMFGMDCPMSPDDHFQDIKRVIAAIGGRARRITVIMPLLYSGRQHKRQSRESLDCAVALQELERLGVDNIFTFDAHDPRVQNAIPLTGFNNLFPTYQIIRAFLKHEKNVVIDKSKMVVVSPDEGAMGRSIYYASMLGLNVNLFYKQRDYTTIINGKNPIIKHEFLGDNIAGMDVLIIDDLIASGESILDIAKELKRRKANRIFIAVTFALFTEGLASYHQAFEEGIITRVYDTNLTYSNPELLKEPWYVNVDMSEFIAYLIDMLNYDQSISPLFDPSRKIGELLKKYQG